MTPHRVLHRIFKLSFLHSPLHKLVGTFPCAKKSPKKLESCGGEQEVFLQRRLEWYTPEVWHFNIAPEKLPSQKVRIVFPTIHFQASGGPDFFPSLWVTQFFRLSQKKTLVKPNQTTPFLKSNISNKQRNGFFWGTFQWAKFGRIGPPSSYPDHLSIPKTKILQAAWGSCKPHQPIGPKMPHTILCETHGGWLLNWNISESFFYWDFVEVWMLHMVQNHAHLRSSDAFSAQGGKKTHRNVNENDWRAKLHFWGVLLWINQPKSWSSGSIPEIKSQPLRFWDVVIYP